MKSNAELQKDVQDAIKWEPLLHAAEIGVTANDGIVTLTGFVSNYAKKLEAETAAKSTRGVKAVVVEIEIQLQSDSLKINDNEIAVEIVTSLNRHPDVPDERLKVKVEKGWVTLEGELQWQYQRIAAIGAVKNLLGIKGIHNNITIKSEETKMIEKNEIESALLRSSELDAKNISVRVSAHKVTLSGRVNSWYQKEIAEHLTWKERGVWMVDNELQVEFD